jgi:hypothetical protein
MIIAFDAIVDGFGRMKVKIFFKIVSAEISERRHAIPLSP